MAANVVRTSAAMSPIFSSGANSVICSQKTGSFLARVFRVDFLGWGGAEDDESLEVLGRAEGIYFEAGSRMAFRLRTSAGRPESARRPILTRIRRMRELSFRLRGDSAIIINKLSWI
jgi:hypothetical protein